MAQPSDNLIDVSLDVDARLCQKPILLGAGRQHLAEVLSELRCHDVSDVRIGDRGRIGRQVGQFREPGRRPTRGRAAVKGHESRPEPNSHQQSRTDEEITGTRRHWSPPEIIRFAVEMVRVRHRTPYWSSTYSRRLTARAASQRLRPAMTARLIRPSGTLIAS